MADKRVETIEGWLREIRFSVGGCDADHYEGNHCSDTKGVATVLIKLLEPVREALGASKVSLSHAIVFLQTREQMHPDGIKLHREDILKVQQALTVLNKMMREEKP